MSNGMKSESTVLVLGATGGIGGEVARQLRDEGWAVKAMQRDVVDPRATGVVADGVTWILGDAMNAAHVARAARDCSVIVHAVNPPGYRKWPQLVLPMLENTIAAARNEQALVLLPGTIYNYGRDAFPLLTEQSPQHPFTRKGAIRVEMEKRLQTHAEQGGRVLIVRAGDFLGRRPATTGSDRDWSSPGAESERSATPASAASAIHGPTFPMSPRRWCGCCSGAIHWIPLQHSTWKASMTMTARK